jgi:hypothetical protein
MYFIIGRRQKWYALLYLEEWALPIANIQRLCGPDMSITQMSACNNVKHLTRMDRDTG